MKQMLKDVIGMLLDVIVSGSKNAAVKWTVLIALAACIAAMLCSCSTAYRSMQGVYNGQDSIVLIHETQGKIKKNR